MMPMFATLGRPILFRLSRNDPEQAHHVIMRALELAAHMPPVLAALQATYGVADPRLERQVFGLRFPNPVGLAGGFDKNGKALIGLAALGFGFIEAGGVTLSPQSGQPRPRIVRLPAEHALINRMGLPNDGAAIIARRLAHQPRPAIPIGWQIAKAKMTPLEGAPQECARTLRLLHPFGDYFTVNVSSPNTPGLRTLQERDRLRDLLAAVVRETRLLATPRQPAKPVLVKISPDLSWSELDDVIAVTLETGARGIIATNTTTSRASLRSDPHQDGGLSGRPLTDRSVEVISYIHHQLNGQLPVVGVGGIMSPDDALRMMDAGAALLQLYTGFIYEGPALITRINRALLDHGMLPTVTAKEEAVS
jgi:dihydroorotate dehydrogenase